MIQNNNIEKGSIIYHMSTKNKSFLDMHYFLQNKGIKNNKFFLRILDPDLAKINPRDPNLNTFMKQKVLRECMANYWYFLREIVLIPNSGGSTGSGVPYKLDRGNLALHYCIMMNFNTFIELPRQQGKTLSIYTRILWEFNFGTTNTETIFYNKKHEDSKLNLARLKEMRDALPTYLQMTETYGQDGKKLKAKNRAESIEHVLNNNKIITTPAARSKVAANSLGRGHTSPRQWMDEFAFIPYNKVMYLATVPAYKTASDIAKRNGAPYGILISTTPGDRTTDEGEYAFQMKENATQWCENFYDLNPQQLNELMYKNENSSFMYIRYTYKQLGLSEEWFRSTVIDMGKDWAAIRREVLLIWETSSDNSPFSKEDLEVAKSYIREPIQTVLLCGYYQFNIYERYDPRNPPIIGVDVSGGFKRDSSAITVIDSKTTKVLADFNCNYINTLDLAKVIYELVTKYMPNAIVNIERNGGFGASVLSKLLSTSIKRNLYYEIKDKIIEERSDGSNIYKKTQKTKIYGLDSTHKTREVLMDILLRRMENHKDKFISPIIYKELETLEIKKNGRIEHTNKGHDDQIFSYLMALYVWYEGKDLVDKFGIAISPIKTDQEAEEAYYPIESNYKNIITQISDNNIDDITKVNEQLKYLNTNVKSYKEWYDSEYKKDRDALNVILSTDIGKKAYSKTYNADISQYENTQTQVPLDIFENFYK